MVNVLLRTIIAIPLILALVLMSGLMFNFAVEPVQDMTDGVDGGLNGAEEAFGDEQEGDNENSIMLFTAVSLVGLILALMMWWLIGDLTQDVSNRQQVRR